MTDTITKRLWRFLLDVCLVLVSCSAYAATDTDSEWLPDQLTLHAFGSLGAVYHEEDGFKYRRNDEQADGAESGELDFATDSVLGAQADLKINDVLRSNLQVVSRNNAFNSWRPEITIATLNYSPNAKWDFRVGRMTTNAIIGIESRFTGYSFLAARPTPEVYGLLAPIDRFDGVDARYKIPMGDGVGMIGFQYGTVPGARNVIVPSKIEHMTHQLLYVEYQQEGLDFFAGVHQFKSTQQNNFISLRNGLNQVGAFGFPQATELANELSKSDTQYIHIYGAGVLWDHKQFTLMSTMAYFTNDAFPGSKGWNGYILGGYRFGNTTPYVSVARSIYTPENKPLNLPPIPAFSALERGYDVFNNALKQDQTAISVGVRFDIKENYALKLQLEHIDAASSPLIVDNNNLGARNVNMNVFSATLDFLF